MSKYFIKKLIRAFLCLWCCIICFIPGVHALEVDSCFDEYTFDNYESVATSDSHFISAGFIGDSRPRYYDSSWKMYTTSGGIGFLSYNKLFEVERGKTYYFTSSSSSVLSNHDVDKTINIFLYNDNKQLLGSLRSISDFGQFDFASNVFIFSIPYDYLPTVNFKYVQIVYYYTARSLYTDSNLFFTDFDLRNATCPSTEPENPPVIDPDGPGKPSITETDELTLLNNFFELFTDRLKFITNFAINSPIFLGFISMFILIIILEFILYLFNKGGYK